jgi:agmatine/peptidylarginine deiminase
MHKVPVTFNLSSSDYKVPLTFTMYHNKQVVYHIDHVANLQKVNIVLEHTDEDQELSWEMAGKTFEHTIIDNKGNIIEDVALITDKFALDGHKLEQLLIDNCVYYHDSNGTSSPVAATYDNYLGCNGKVIFKFTAPAYIWILKNW